jgi:Putative transposase/Transposase zinc-binding domain
VPRPALEVADVFREHGPEWRQANAGHVSLEQLKVMSAIESCRTAALGGHVMRCEDCAHTLISYNSCRDRHCPKCLGGAAREWLAAREADLLPVPYFHVLFSLPKRIADIAYQNKAVIYGILFKAAADTLLTIAADPEHLGARIGITAVLHTWGSSSPPPYDRARRWVLARRQQMDLLPPGLLPSGAGPLAAVPQIVSATARRRPRCRTPAVLHRSRGARRHQGIRRVSGAAARRRMGRLRQEPFGGPEQVLRYMARYTHRVAIANSRLVAIDHEGVSFKWKDYRVDGPERIKVMTLAPEEFIRRFLIHVLPAGFHRIRHYGLLASSQRRQNIARARQLLNVPAPQPQPATAENVPPADSASLRPCPCCSGRMFVIEVFTRGRTPRYRATAPVRDMRIDNS